MMYRKADKTELQNSNEFCQAVKFVIKLQITTLREDLENLAEEQIRGLKQLAESGEESVVIIANVSDGTADHLGSDKGAGFLRNRDELQSQFLSFCSGSVSLDGVLDSEKSPKDEDYLDASGNHLGTAVSGFRSEEMEDYSSRLLSPSRLRTSVTDRSSSRQRYERDSTESVFSPGRVSSHDFKGMDGDYDGMGVGRDYEAGGNGRGDYSHEPAADFGKFEPTWDNGAPAVTSLDLTDRHTHTKYPAEHSPTDVQDSQHGSDSSPIENVSLLRKPAGSRVAETSHSLLHKPSTSVPNSGSIYRGFVPSGSDSASSGSYTYPTSNTPLDSSALDPAPDSPPYTSSAMMGNQLTVATETEAPLRIQRKADTRIYSRLGGGGPRKPVKSGVERRAPDYEGVPLRNMNVDRLPLETGLLAPVNMSNRPSSQVPRGSSNRERSQSLSAVASLSPDTGQHGRTRFFSASFDGSSDNPLVIDEDVHIKSEPDAEGLDLSSKRPRLISGEYSSMAINQSRSSPGSHHSETTAEENGMKEVYDRLVQMSNANNLQVDPSSSNSVKKYGKGNFIKVATGYQCRICNRVIRHMNNTTAHMRIHANVKPYKCQVCHQQFKYEVDRRFHFSKQHADLFSKMHFPGKQSE